VDVPAEVTGGATAPTDLKTLDQLIQQGKSLPKVQKLKWSPGQGARTAAFLCYSSGTSGLPVSWEIMAVSEMPANKGRIEQKGVMISHRNVIANAVQVVTMEATFRDLWKPPGQTTPFLDIVLGLLPQSHIYALVFISHAGPSRGDQVIVLPKFEMKSYLNAIQRFHIGGLFLVRLHQSHYATATNAGLIVAVARFRLLSSTCCATRNC
jgi:acyl-CoA synthetase (AMP-forming)/AMP-acid ligase II